MNVFLIGGDDPERRAEIAAEIAAAGDRVLNPCKRAAMADCRPEEQAAKEAKLLQKADAVLVIGAMDGCDRVLSEMAKEKTEYQRKEGRA